MKEKKILEQYINVHNQMIEKNGFTEKSLWGSKESQQLRFKIITEIFQSKSNFSILDVGCGLCNFFDYLCDNDFKDFNYTGLEINPQFVEKSKQIHPNIEIINGTIENLNFSNKWDYAVASGIYNLGNSLEETQNFFVQQFKQVFENVNIGFAVNFLSKYSENKDNISVYHDPAVILNLCTTHFSKYIKLYQNYLPHDFTVFVYKNKIY